MKEIEIPRNKIRENEGLPNNITTVETANGIFRIIYGIHIFTENKASIQGVHGLVLESAVDNHTTATQAERMINGEYGYKTGIQYKEIIKHCEEENIPIFFADLTSSTLPIEISFLIGTTEKFTALRIIYSRLFQIMRDKTMLTRKDFLKFAVGAFFSTSLFSAMTGVSAIIAGNGKSSQFNKLIESFDEKIHPETKRIALTLRNYLFAQKLYTIARKMKALGQNNQKPTIAISIGGRHHGIEDALRKTDYERVASINHWLKFPGLKKARSEIATIARLDFSKEENRWEATEIFKDPSLATIQ